MIDPTQATANDAYDVAFQVYGLGPGLSRRALVVKIIGARPRGNIARPLKLVGQNILTETPQSSGPSRLKGGKYSATLVLEPRGGLLTATLHGIKPIR
jgi:hypothetical protein